MDFYAAFYDLDENCVFVWMADGKIAAMNCAKVENDGLRRIDPQWKHKTVLKSSNDMHNG